MEVNGVPRYGRFFHIGVRNRHRRKVARNCYAYLDNVTRLEPLTAIPVRAVEIKWEGYMLPGANIPSSTFRNFDAFYILHDEPTRLRFQLFTDSSAFIPDVSGVAQYKLCYSIVADSFPTARATFLLTLDQSLDSTTLEKVKVDC